MNTNIVKTQFFQKIKYDLKGPLRSQTTTYFIKKFTFSLVCVIH